METIENQLAEWLTEKTGIYILSEKDIDLNSTILNESHGVLRLISDEHGVNNEIYTESAGYAVDFVIVKDESEEFTKKIRSLAIKYKASDVAFEDDPIVFKNGIKGKFYFGNCIINGDIESTNGIDLMSYQMTFNLSLFEALIPSDNATVIINGEVLTGVVNVIPCFSTEKEPFVSNGELLPKFETTSKSMVIQLQYMPLEGNKASNFLINKMNTLDTSPFRVKLVWPSIENPLLDVENNFFAKDITLNLVKGTFAGINLNLVMEG